MPHDCLDLITRTTVVQTVLGTRQTERQTTSPEWRGTTPARADIILHEQAVLHHIGVGPDGLVGKTRQTLLWVQTLLLFSLQ